MGYPTRPSRLAFGPTYENRYPVNDPTKEVGATTFNLNFWQLAGAGVVSPLAWAEIVVSATDTVSLGASAEAWDADAGVVPTVSKIGVGQYRLTYASSYPNEVGTSVTTDLTFGLPVVRSSTFFHAQAVRFSNYEIDIYIWDSANNPDDPTSSSVFVAIW